MANFALNGLTDWVGKDLGNKFLFVRYADDFLVLGESKEDLKKIALPRVNEFLKLRGLKLNLAKTAITDISEGFDYLGYHFREYSNITRAKGTKKGTNLLKKQKGICPVCDGVLRDNMHEDLEVHHILPRKERGSDKLSNLLLLHKTCHQQITYSKNEHLRAVWREKRIIK